MHEIIIAGAGTGNFLHLTREVISAINYCDVIFASERFKKLIPDNKKFVPFKKFDDLFSNIEKESGQVLILLSGDTGIYSLLPLIKKRFADKNIRVLPGISSLQVLCSYAQELWNDAVIISGHGRNLNAGKFMNIIERNKKVILFCDKLISPQWVCKNISSISGIEVYIGENLGSVNQKIYSGKPYEFMDLNFSELSLILIKNNSPFVPKNIHPRDYEFMRSDGIVMTNEAVRSVILGRLNLNNDSIFWDIEYKHNAAELISRNAMNFHLHNITVHESRAMNVLDKLPSPSHVFVGGSEGELHGIIDYVAGIDNQVKLVTACVTLETFNKAYELMKTWPEFEAVEVSISHSKQINHSSTLMHSHNSVMILCALSEKKFIF